MNYVFFGTPEFAAIILKNLLDAGLPPAAVVCNPDRPVGRKKIITPPPTKLLAQKYNILIWQPEVLSDIRYQISDIRCDFFVVVAYAKILPKEILAIPRLGVIGVHPSLLPKYRGATPIQTAILESEPETGVTLYRMDEKVDHGPIIRNQKSEVRSQNYKALEVELAHIAGNMLLETLPKFARGEIQAKPQDESLATFTKKFTAEDAYVNPRDLEAAVSGDKDKANEIERKIRALNPEPGVWTAGWAAYGDKRVKLLEAAVADGKLRLVKIQAEGKKPQIL